MPVTKSVVKKVRQAEKRRADNKAKKSNLKTTVSKITLAKPKEKSKLYPKVQSTIDKAAKKRLLHPNKASRMKSKLAKAAK
ncbi:30S ribosomal protein S20 [bacterium]|nr:30S ribosomal protein S20 [bacterium]